MGFTIAIFDTAAANSAAAHFVTEAADLCLLPTRPTCLDVDATAATFRAVYLAKRRAAFVLNQCPPNYRSLRTSKSAKGLARLGVLAGQLYARAWIFRMRLKRVSVSPSTLAEAEPHGKSRRFGVGFAPSLNRHKVKRQLIFHHVDRRPLKARQARALSQCVN